MKPIIFILIAVGILLIFGAWNKKAIRIARKVGNILSPLSGVSFTISRLSEQDKNSIARLCFIWFGSIFVIASILALIFRL